MKTVTVEIKMDAQFIRLLNANVILSGLRAKDELQPIDQLALIVLMEARGAFEEEVHAATLPMWRNNIEAVHEVRQVIEIKDDTVKNSS